MNSEELYTVIMPTIAKDIEASIPLAKYWEKYLPIKKLVFIGNSDVEKRVKDFPFQCKDFINENDIVEFDYVKKLIDIKSKHNEQAINRTGWYVQQFIKMGYANVCEDDYYLSWDSDTIPLSKVNMVDDGKPLFDMKDEYNKPYFDTLGRIIPNTTKMCRESFISEHMLFSREIMLDLLNSIENNKSIEGENWIEKIINAISLNDLSYSGFSEFETYGTFTEKNYPKRYNIRKWNSCRLGNELFDPNNISDSTFDWLKQSFDAISFEKNSKKDRYWKIFNSTFMQKFFSFHGLYMVRRYLRG